MIFGKNLIKENDEDDVVTKSQLRKTSSSKQLFDSLTVGKSNNNMQFVPETRNIPRETVSVNISTNSTFMPPKLSLTEPVASSTSSSKYNSSTEMNSSQFQKKK